MHAMVMKGKEKLGGGKELMTKISVTENQIRQTVGISPV